MASIERTAYPRFKHNPTAKELNDFFTPTKEEVHFFRSAVRNKLNLFHVLVLLKSFQRLGYFPSLLEIPSIVVNHIRNCQNVPANTPLGYDEPRTMYRHYQLIRKFVKVTPCYGKKVRHIAVKSVYEAAQIMDNPADLINVVVEELIRKRCELPAFSSLDRMVRRVRTLVNRRIFQKVLGKLTATQMYLMESLFEIDLPGKQSAFYALKQLPKRPSISHLEELLKHLTWLISLGDIEILLEGIPALKLLHFAAEAKGLDAGEMKDINSAKRYTLLLSLVHRARVQTRDDLATMFIKRMATLHKKGKEALADIQVKHREKTENLVAVFSDVLQILEEGASDADVGRQVRSIVEPRGGATSLLDDCNAVTAYSGNNYLPLLWKFYRSHRKVLFSLVRALKLDSTSQDRSLIKAVSVLIEHENSRGDFISVPVDLSFAEERWKSLLQGGETNSTINRRHFEICVFSHLATELKSGDISVDGSDAYADHRKQMLSWKECEPMVADYCRELKLPDTAAGFVEKLKAWLTEKAEEVDKGYPDNRHVVIDEKGEPVLKRYSAKEQSQKGKELEAIVIERLKERNLLDILCNVEHWVNWTRHFGPLSGSDPKLKNPVERYILTTFAYGCNLGPNQAARHMRGDVTPHVLSFTNRRHISATKLDGALKDIINQYSRFDLPKHWGSGKRAGADGTQYDLYEQNLISEYHIRYGSSGGIAYHHISDTYIALFSHFIPCGVWEAVYIIEGLLKNKSDIQPDTLHSDTQGQSEPVFGLSYLLGIDLMPRIRNWKDLKFYRPSKKTRYKHIDPLFSDVINWKLIETHWEDLMQVVLSIKMGKISSAVLLRKLGNYSRKNRLYQAFCELGRVVRTVFLLKYISDLPLRQEITAVTNIVESYNGFSKWFFFGGEGVIAENDPDEQEKRIKYNDLVANAVIFQNVVDITQILWDLEREGYHFADEDIATLSPYMTRSVKRFGEYVINLKEAPDPLDEEMFAMI